MKANSSVIPKGKIQYELLKQVRRFKQELKTEEQRVQEAS